MKTIRHAAIIVHVRSWIIPIFIEASASSLNTLKIVSELWNSIALAIWPQHMPLLVYISKVLYCAKAVLDVGLANTKCGVIQNSEIGPSR